MNGARWQSGPATAIPPEVYDRFSSKDPWVVLGVKKNATKREIKKTFHKLALMYHPDNPDTGNLIIMNCINQAYGKISDPGERLETMKEAEDVRTAGKTWSEHQQTAEGMHANFASRASRWKETEDHRRRMKERLRKNKYKKSIRKGVTHLGFEPFDYTDHCFKLGDGTYIYFIKGIAYESDHYIPPLDIQYQVISKGQCSPEVLKRYGLRPVGDTFSKRKEHVVKLKQEMAIAQRTLPSLSAEYEGYDELGPGPIRKMFRDQNWIERGLGVGIACFAVVLFLQFLQDSKSFVRMGRGSHPDEVLAAEQLRAHRRAKQAEELDRLYLRATDDSSNHPQNHTAG